MMRFKYLGYLAFALGGLSTVLAAGALYLHVSFDGVRLAAELSHFTKQRYQRTLTLEGPLGLEMFPFPRLHLPAASLSVRNGDRELGGFEGASMRVRLLPLLGGRLVVDRIELEGLRLALQRGRDGKVNVDDLLAAAMPDASPIMLEGASLTVNGGSISWNDELAGQRLGLSGLSLNTGPLARQAEGLLAFGGRLVQAAPAIDGQVAVQGAYRLGDAGVRQLRQLHATLKGAVAGQAEVGVEVSATELQIPVEGPPQLAEASLVVRGKLADAPCEVRATTSRLVLAADGPAAERLDARFRVEGAGQGASGRSQLRGLKATRAGVGADEMGTEFEWHGPLGRLRGRLAGPLRLQPPAPGFDVAIDRLELDLLLAGKHADRLDPAWLRGLELAGVMRIARLQLGGLQLERVRLPISLADGRLVSQGHAASLYGGKMEGSLTLTADSPRLTYRSYLQHANVGSLLHDLSGKPAFSGLANLFVDLHCSGLTSAACGASLEGVARVRLLNGVVAGIDAGSTLQEWRSQIQARQHARRPYRDSEGTALDEVTASFAVHQGVAHSSDLQAKSRLFRLSGAGDIDLSAGRLDLRSHLSLVLLPGSVDSGPLAGLRGLRVPFRVEGPWSAPVWELEPEVRDPLAASAR